MSQPSGTRTTSEPCRYCGKRYVLTNFMKRNRGPALRDDQGRLLNNTHLRACYKKWKAQQT